MPHKTFFAFMAPSLLAMLLFIALPILSILVQSLHVEHPQVLRQSETCQPLGGCRTETVVDTAATAALREGAPLGQWNGIGTYLDRNHLATGEIGTILQTASGPGDVAAQILNLPFWRALAFTLTYCLTVTPLAMGLGLAIALAVNTVPRFVRGPVIFFSLVPMLITPLVGALVLFWMINAEGILGAAIQHLFNDPTLSLQSSTGLTWATLITYGTWTNAPFSFIVFYAGLQAVPRDTVEAAMIDGANRWERLRFVTIPIPAAAAAVRAAGAVDGQLQGVRADHLVQRRRACHVAVLSGLFQPQHPDLAALRLGRRDVGHHHRLHHRADPAGDPAHRRRNPEAAGIAGCRTPSTAARAP